MSQPSSTTQRLLEVLIALGDGHATGPQLAARMRVLPGSIPPYIAELRKLGYDIESDPHLGFRLGHCPDILLADELKARLHTQRVGRDVVVYKQTDSTSDVVERLGLDGVEEGVVVVAESQTKGRGRRGRSWVSPRGAGLWFSVLLRPSWPPQAVTRITILSAVALIEALEEVAGLAAQIKWPNDVLVSGRKLAGILTEMETDSDQVRFVTLGVGVNVHAMNFPPELEATATTVQAERGQPVRRADLVVALLRRLDALYAQAVANDFEPITRKWGARSSTLGKRVVIVVGSRRIEGQAMALDENGSLLVRTDNARTEQIIGGDVILERA